MLKLALLNNYGQSLDTAIHAMNQYIPRKITRKCNGLPWITPTIQRQIRKRNKLYQQYKTLRLDETRQKF